MEVPNEIKQLVSRFEHHKSTYRSPSYKEARLRQDFLDPLFRALGWDVENSEGRSEIYRDVVIEESIKDEDAPKAPDYGFRIGGERKFFVEAKRPSLNLSKDPSPAYQLRRYSWSAKLPIGILTDFEEFAVYDCRIRPEKTDSARKARLFYINFKEYADRWDEIASLFSKDALLDGSFDRYVEDDLKTKRGGSEVDDEFLKEIESWREMLAYSIAQQNPNLTQRELNYAVQMTIDRIIFLRICEDRGIEEYGRLGRVASEGEVYRNLGEYFRDADDRYNSGLFHFRNERSRAEPPDTFTLELDIPDQTLRTIIERLYYPDSPYEFSVLPTDILGQVYEQFLGKVIRLDSSTEAVIEEKPEVKKAGGVYYTPTHIVEAIVDETVAKLCRGRTPDDVAQIRILDPACGSGSFLLGAFQYLLDWHLQWYVTDDPERWTTGRRQRIYQVSTTDWRLTTHEKKRILLNNIYGVDIDTQAVEVTKLSLLLKVLENENEETIENTRRLFQERALPDLGENIKCGNSLVGSDIYHQDDIDELTDEDLVRINPFDYGREFEAVMDDGGFDAVIGNPPYSNYSARDSMRAFYERHGMDAELRQLKATIAYCADAYPAVSEGCKDIYKWFTYRALQLCKPRGAMGYIVPNTWFQLPKYEDLKSFIFTSDSTVLVYDLGFGVFPVTVPTCLLICQRFNAEGGNHYVDLKEEPKQHEILKRQLKFTRLTRTGDLPSHPLVQTYMKDWPEDSRLKDSVTLREGQHIPRKRLTEGHESGYIPIVDSKNITRYTFDWEPRFSFKSEQDDKFKTTSGPRIVIRKTGDRIVASLIPSDESYVLQSLYQSVAIDGRYDPAFILGLLNSSLLTFLYQESEYGQKGRTMAQFRKGYLDELPFPVLNLNSQKDKDLHDTLVTRVNEMVSLKNKLANAKTPNRQKQLTRQVQGKQRQIDELVNDAYGLTDDEIEQVGEVDP